MNNIIILFSRFQRIDFIQNTRMTSSQFLNLNSTFDSKVGNFYTNLIVCKIKNVDKEKNSVEIVS